MNFLIKNLNIFLEFHWLGGYGEQCMLVNVPQSLTGTNLKHWQKSFKHFKESLLLICHSASHSFYSEIKTLVVIAVNIITQFTIQYFYSQTQQPRDWIWCELDQGK